MAPKKELSSSSSRRRVRASSSSMSPVERSASMAICLPGMASRENRAETSAMRPEPLVITMKLTITRIAKTMIPITKLLPMTKPPKASMTWPAASVPMCPSARISRVDARFSDSRPMVASRSTVGNVLNCSGRSTNSAVIRINTENVIENAREISSSDFGIGRMRTTKIATTQSARTISPRPANLPKLSRTFHSTPVCWLSVVAGVPASAMRKIRPRRQIGRRL